MRCVFLLVRLLKSTAFKDDFPQTKEMKSNVKIFASDSYDKSTSFNMRIKRIDKILSF